MSVGFKSTNLQSEVDSFEEALIMGQAPDRGLYMPKTIPTIDSDVIFGFSDMDYHEIAYSVIDKFIGDEIPNADLRRIVEKSYDFDIPLENVYDDVYVMRLDRGPTASFKDFAARFMARAMQYFLGKRGESLTILTATSGDTGSAVANAFHGMDNIKVVVLFPESEVTEIQRAQMTSLGGNVNAMAVKGKFDDCQALVKRAFSDDKNSELKLSSANSINFGRLLPQSVYYFYAFSRLHNNTGRSAVFSVPCGNFGDLMGGLLAKEMGLPVKRFIAATNENDVFPKYLQSGDYKPLKPSRKCISNAMNVGHPSNLARIIHLYGGTMDESGLIIKQPNMNSLKEDIWSLSVSEEETRKGIKEAYENYKLILEPHGSVAWVALKKYLMEVKENEEFFFVSFETADPAKFPESIVESIGINPEIPKSIAESLKLPESYDTIEAEYGELLKKLRLF
jgi:threonine synthase